MRQKLGRGWQATLQVMAGLLLCLMAPAALAGPVLMLSDTFQRAALGEYVEYLEDPDHNLSLDDVRSPAFDGRFTASKHSILQLGFTRSAYWLRLSVHNPDMEARELILDLRSASLGTIQLYEPQTDGN